MPGRHQFVVPQFLDVESKIIGPITARQFLILLAVLLAEFVVYRVFLSLLFQLALGVPILAAGLTFAFFRVNGQPFHFIALNMVQSFRKPMLRVWDKSLSDGDLRVYLKKDDAPPPPPPARKSPIEHGRLSELTMVVNTGGVYTPDDNNVL